MRGISRTASCRATAVAGLPALLLMAACIVLAGCGETPKPAESSGSVKGSKQEASAKSDRAAPEEVPENPPMQSEPEPASETTLRAVAPAELQEMVASHEGKLVLVDFWATWCPPCVAQFPHTVELSTKHAKDLVVYAVSFDNADKATRQEVAAFYQKYNSGNVQTLVSAGGGSDDDYEDFQITGGALPHYKLYGRDGKLIKAFGGDVDNPLSPEQIDKAIAAALGE